MARVPLTRGSYERPLIGRSLVLLLMGVIGTGCQEPPAEQPAEPGPGLVVSDSAGIRIVQNGNVSEIVAPFRLSVDPVFRIGWNENDPEFVSVSAAALLSDGRAVVADGGAADLMLLSADGQFQGYLGRRGQGPGEFWYVSSISLVGEDTIVAFDPGNYRVNYFSDGELIRDQPVAPSVSELSMLGVLPEGAVAFGLPPTRSGPMRPGMQLDRSWIEVPLTRVGLELDPTAVDGRGVDTIRMMDVAQRSGGRLGPAGANALSGGWIAVGRGDRAEVHWLDGSGQVQQIARWQVDSLPITDAVWEEYASDLRAFSARGRGPWIYLDGGVDELLDIQRRDSSGYLPYFRGWPPWVTDLDGNVWMGEYAGFIPDGIPNGYLVLGSDGQWVGRVTMPPGFRLLAVGDDRVIGVEQDTYEVEAVAVYAIER